MPTSLTIVGFQVAMQNHNLILRPQSIWFGDVTGAHEVLADFWGVHPIVTAIERRDELGEDTPYIFLLGELVLGNQRLDNLTQIPTIAILHVYVQLLGCLEMFSMVVPHNVWVPQRVEDGEFCVELLSLFLRHSDVAYLFATEYLVSYKVSSQSAGRVS